MEPRMKTLALLLSATTAVVGCTQLNKGNDETQVATVAPLQTVKHGAARAEAQYALGRYFRGQERYAEAMAAFREAIAIDPKHAEARNALGVLYAGTGQLELAVPELEKAAAIEPLSASIRNNLGYAYLLRGQVAEAAVVLETAARLDPRNPRVRENLKMARVAVAELAAKTPASAATPENAPSRAPNSETTAQASSAAEAGARPVAAEASPAGQARPAPTAAAATTPAVATGARTMAAAATPAAAAAPAVKLGPPPTMAGIQAKVSARLIEKQETQPRVAPPPAVKPPAMTEPRPEATPQSSAADAVHPARAARLEVANGNGVSGLARATGRELQSQGFTRPRLTNAKPFTLPTSQIQYRAGFEREARELQAVLKHKNVPIAPTASLRVDVHVRLALGHDVRGVEDLLAVTGQSERLVQAPAPTRLALTARGGFI